MRENCPCYNLLSNKSNNFCRSTNFKTRITSLSVTNILYVNSFYRGKGEGGRLGHVAEDHMRHPKVIEAFSGKKIIDVAVGSVHSLAVTEDGEVYSWGRNEQGQLGDTSNIARTEPALIAALESKEITGVACGPAQVRFFFYICRLNY